MPGPDEIWLSSLMQGSKPNLNCSKKIKAELIRIAFLQSHVTWSRWRISNPYPTLKNKTPTQLFRQKSSLLIQCRIITEVTLWWHSRGKNVHNDFTFTSQWLHINVSLTVKKSQRDVLLLYEKLDRKMYLQIICRHQSQGKYDSSTA